MKIKDSATLVLNSLPQDQKISIYNCGPTVYNDVHIGNIRPVIVLDVLYRYLKYKNFDVLYFHNITDIDDKIIAKASQENCSEKKITKKFYGRYVRLLNSLDIVQPRMPLVSKNIKEIISFIDELIKLKFAYEKNGDVYFDISKIKQYGEVSHQNIEELIDGSRIKNSKNKNNSLDFVLWKKTSIGKKWKTKWSIGRPGWHTECVSLINKFIGNQVTIHAGGMDLKFPHHENENAQNIAINGQSLAKSWMHIGHITIDDEKMAKSKNNFVLAKTILEKHSANIIKWFFFQTQYHNPLNFSEESLNQSEKDLEKIQKSINAAALFLIENKLTFKIPKSIITEEKLEEEFENNLNIPNVITYVWEKIRLINVSVSKKDYKNVIKNLNEIFSVFEILGLNLNFKVPYSTKKTYINWRRAIRDKNFFLADSLRKQLKI